MSKQMNSDPIETVGKRLSEIKRRLRHATPPYSAACYDNQVFFTNAVEDMNFLLELVTKERSRGGKE